MVHQVYNKFRNYNVAIVFFQFTLAFGLLVILLALFGYHFTFVKLTNDTLPILITLVSFYILGWVRKIEKIWVISVTIMVAIILGWFSLTINSYETIESPNGNIKVMISHRGITLGETNHFYELYLYTSVPGLVKKVNEETIHIITRGESATNLQILGVENAVWINGEKVILKSPYAGEIQVEFKSRD
ncbi:hypothetical protein [Psychrobacillus psychrotolerans]|uniref:hypothetical protein n=1 Tax=Psychrobacillus psychrotolerans TaxID=126156 RepID=UPI003B016D0D